MYKIPLETVLPTQDVFNASLVDRRYLSMLPDDVQCKVKAVRVSQEATTTVAKSYGPPDLAARDAFTFEGAKVSCYSYLFMLAHNMQQRRTT